MHKRVIMTRMHRQGCNVSITREHAQREAKGCHYSLIDRASRAVKASWTFPLVCLNSCMASSRENPTDVICCMAASGNDNDGVWLGGGGWGECEVREEVDGVASSAMLNVQIV